MGGQQQLWGQEVHGPPDVIGLQGSSAIAHGEEWEEMLLSNIWKAK